MDAIRCIQSELLRPHSWLIHGFLGRTGGVSPRPFGSLNLSLATGDSPENIEKNLNIVASFMGISRQRLAILRQTHGDGLVYIESPSQCGIYRYSGDALVTTRRGIALCVLTADCVPIIVVDREGSLAAIIHAGWRGTLKGIALNTVNRLRDRFGIPPRRLMAAIGPSIGGCCYTVGSPVVDMFHRAYPEAPGVEPGQRRLDLKQINRWQLLQTGIEDIDTIDVCTCCNVDSFFSHRKEGTTGRQINLVTLRECG